MTTEILGIRNARSFPLGILSYLGTSMADAAITAYHSRVSGYIDEGNALAYRPMENLVNELGDKNLGTETGLAISLGTEYFAIFGLTPLILPRKLRGVPLAIASYLHINGFVNHLDALIGNIPDQLYKFPVNLVIEVTQKIMS